MIHLLNKKSFHTTGVLHWLKNNVELLFWITGLLLLFFTDMKDPSRSLCIFRLAGFEGCPGCGIGHAIHDALHFNFKSSFSAHFMGIPAVLIILHRIKQLIFTKKQQLT